MEDLLRVGYQEQEAWRALDFSSLRTLQALSRQISAVPDLCCIVTRRLVESVGGVFDPIVSSAIAVFEHVKDELAVIPCVLPATL